MRKPVALAVAAATVLVLAGCSDPGATTCDEYAAMTRNERSDLERDLLLANDLEPNDLGNMTGVRDALNNFCGTTGIALLVGDTEEASRNHTEPLTDAVDWDSSYW